MFVCFLIQTSILYLDGVGLLFISTETWILEENISYPQAMTLPGLDDKWGITLKKQLRLLFIQRSPNIRVEKRVCLGPGVVGKDEREDKKRFS